MVPVNKLKGETEKRTLLAIADFKIVFQKVKKNVNFSNIYVADFFCLKRRRICMHLLCVFNKALSDLNLVNLSVTSETSSMFAGHKVCYLHR